MTDVADMDPYKVLELPEGPDLTDAEIQKVRDIWATLPTGWTSALCPSGHSPPASSESGEQT